MANMKKNMRTRKKVEPIERGGFTIIEVVLVLAVAGLIFLMVFIALPALQRSQRDTQRRENLGAVTKAITNYQTNNNGKLPGNGGVSPYDEETKKNETKLDTWCTSATPSDSMDSKNSTAGCLIKRYIAGTNDEYNTFSDPDGYTYGLKIQNYNETAVNTVRGLSTMDHTIYVFRHARCGDNETAVESKNARDYVVMYLMEGSGMYCQDNG